MKKIRKLAVLLCAVLVLMLSLATVAYAYGGEEAPEASAIASPSPTASVPAETTGGLEPFTPAGTGTVLNTATDEDGKQFYTITTPDKNVFYLVIDLQRKTDNVYFLNAVTEADLLALAEKSGDSKTGTGLSAPASGTTAAPASTPPTQAEPSPEPSTAPQGNNMGTLLLVLAVVVIGGGAGYYVKIYRPKKQRADSEEEADYLPEESSFESEDTDDLPPWEDKDSEDDQG